MSARDSRFRRVLWVALIANAAMSFVEAAVSWSAESTALLADAVLVLLVAAWNVWRGAAAEPAELRIQRGMEVRSAA